MADWSAEKKRWLVEARRSIQPAYDILVKAGGVIVSSENRPDIGIVFPKSKFAHLIGLEYYTDNSKRHRTSDTVFYDDLMQGRVEGARTDYTHRNGGRATTRRRHDFTAMKISIAEQAFTELPRLDTLNGFVVDSAKIDGSDNPIVIFVGRTVWALGLSPQRTKDGRDTGSYIPRSLVKDNVLSERNRRKGTTVSRITGVRFRNGI